MTDNSLLRFRKNQKYIVYDFETEGLNLRYSKPWQLGFIIAEGKKVKESYDLYIDFEDLNISDDARRLTGFSDTVYNETLLEKFKKYKQFENKYKTFLVEIKKNQNEVKELEKAIKDIDKIIDDC